jgi:hypothetical protein
MSPKERLIRYFELNHRRSQLTVDEYHEMLHLEEALVDDIDHLDLPDDLRELQQKFINVSIELMAGPYAIMDTGSGWDAMYILLESALPKLSGRERMAIADLIGGRIAVGGPYPSRREYIKQFRKK